MPAINKLPDNDKESKKAISMKFRTFIQPTHFFNLLTDNKPHTRLL